MKYRLLTFLLLLSFLPVFAQKTRTQRCAPANGPRQPYIPQVRSYADMEFGLRKPFMFRYDGTLDEHYSFISQVRPYACFSYSMHLFNRFEFYSGAELAFIRPGLKFRYTEQGNTFSEKMHQGLFMSKIQAGISCNVQPGWKITVAPSVAYNSVWEYSTNGAHSARAGSIASYRYNWLNDVFYDQLYFGADLKTEHRLARNLYLDLSVSIDIQETSRFEGEVEMSFIDGRTETYKAAISPYLLHAGAGLSFRFLQRGGY